MILAATDLHKSYRLPRKRLEVLRGASLQVEAGERVAIVGRSGAGKSTLLYVFGGLDRPDSGSVLIDGQPLYGGSRRLSAHIRAAKIGFVFQSYHLLPEMDITENVMLPAMTGARRMTRPEMRRRALDLLSKVGLADRSAHKPLELSGGEQQRVALARALMNDPALILADEPTGNLDQFTGSQIMDLLFSLSLSQRLAIIMVTHSPATAALCSRRLTLENGVLA